MKPNEVLDVSCARINQRLRRQVSQELVTEARKRGPAPGTGGAPPKDAPKDYQLSVRLSKADQDLIGAATSKTGESLAEFVREAAIKKALRSIR